MAESSSEEDAPLGRRRAGEAPRASPGSSTSTTTQKPSVSPSDEGYASGSSSDDAPIVGRGGGRARKAELSKPPAPVRPPRRPPARPKPSGSSGRAASSKAQRKTASLPIKPNQTRPKPKRKGRDSDEEPIPNDARKYFREGQKHITPPNGDGTRAYYESLLQENPNSILALKYLIEWGVLTGTALRAALPRFQVLRELGVFRGNLGGVKEEWREGVTEKHFKMAKKLGKQKNQSPRRR
eukprot:GHVT01101330.1.p1 GENE.GHVT01101330.1~~GHVT01101330.1.p1  ORF type:complete len:239 (+),score=65.20 GHVT01101330.1:296-1012(+)